MNAERRVYLTAILLALGAYWLHVRSWASTCHAKGGTVVSGFGRFVCVQEVK